jgi:hypothetical protein
MRQRAEFGAGLLLAALPRLDKRFTPAILERRGEAQRSLTRLQQPFNCLNSTRLPVGSANERIVGEQQSYGLVSARPQLASLLRESVNNAFCFGRMELPPLAGKFKVVMARRPIAVDHWTRVPPVIAANPAGPTA